jgi:hypothetical protein
METCYKVFKKDIFKKVTIKCDRFDFEPEITAKVLKQKVRLIELPISYYGRDYEEGKKITWKDGIWAIMALVLQIATKTVNTGRNGQNCKVATCSAWQLSLS